MTEIELLAEELRGFGLRASNGDVLQKLTQLGLKWDIDESALVEKYVAFQRNEDLPDEISPKHVEQFDREISSKFESVKYKTIKISVPSTVTPKLLPQKMLEELMATESQNDQLNLFSSYIPNLMVPPLSASPMVPAANKENIGPAAIPISSEKLESACIFPLAIEDHRFKTSPRSPSSEWKVDVLNNSMAPVRYMHQPTLEKAEALDNWVWDLVKQIIAKLPEESFTESTINPGSSSQLIHCPSVSPSPLRGALSGSSSQPVTKATGSLERTTYLRPTYVRLQTSSLVAGRVASSTSTLSSQLTTEAKENDLQMTKNRLQPGNAAVIGLRRVEGAGGSADAMTRLEFPMANSCVYSIFSGQPVILRATNPTGRQLNVTDVFTTAKRQQPKPAHESAWLMVVQSVLIIRSHWDSPPHPQSLAQYPKINLCVMVATGPYTFANSNDPSLLLTFLREVKRNRPHVLILLGPIVDANHPVVQTYCETTYEELFQSRLNSVAEYCSHLDVQLIVVPSWRDAHHDPVYPTPPFDSDWTQQTTELIGHFRNVHFVWDPTVVSIGGYVFGFTSVDVLFHLSSEEISSGCSGDRMARLCQHILSSRTFYPVHPPADDLPLDYVLWTQRAQLSSAPHCLICPSRLRQFVKDVDGVLCINPGHVSRGQSSGSYATITIHTDTPNDHEHGISDDAANGSTCSWSIANRTAVHVYRL